MQSVSPEDVISLYPAAANVRRPESSDTLPSETSPTCLTVVLQVRPATPKAPSPPLWCHIQTVSRQSPCVSPPPVLGMRSTLISLGKAIFPQPDNAARTIPRLLGGVKLLEKREREKEKGLNIEGNTQMIKPSRPSQRKGGRSRKASRFATHSLL